MMNCEEPEFFIDTAPSTRNKRKFKHENSDFAESYEKKPRLNQYEHFIEKSPPKQNRTPSKRNEIDSKDAKDSDIKAAIVYYENILKDLKKGIFDDMKDAFISNVLEESEGKEVELACHSVTSHCLEILLTDCVEISVLTRFMTAFLEEKVSAFTSSNASHLTELLLYHAVKALQNWSIVMDLEDETKEKVFVSYCLHWLEMLGSFAVENLDDCLQSQHSCHVLCTLIAALAGDLAGNKELRSKNLKNHKREFHSQFSDVSQSRKIQEQSAVVLEQIPKSFSDLIKTIYKSLVKSEKLTDFVNDSCSATVIEALIFALKKRHPKACKKMITKLAKKMFLDRNQENIPLSLLHKNASYVFDEMFKAADEDLQLTLWEEYISKYIGQLAIDPVGNFVVQRLFDAIKSKSLFETACKHMWCLLEKIAASKNFGIFVSLSTACNRLGSQQASFMENIMKYLQCFEPVERQDFVIPLLLGFQKYDRSMLDKKSETNLKICLQGSLVVQAILKYQKPLKAVKSILSMSPEEIAFLAGHVQGCHALNAFFGSVTVGEKNKEKLLHHIQPVLVSMACDRNKSLTLSRIWTCLSLKLKEIVARELFNQQNSLKNTKSGYAVFQKFSISRFRKLQEWRQIQSNITCNKKLQKH